MNCIGGIAAITLAAILASCATSTPIRVADGRQGFSIDCGSDYLNSSWTACYEKAGEACGARGYDIVERIGERGYSVYVGQYGGGGGSTFGRSMIIACKKG
jgi:hypothetical protein